VHEIGLRLRGEYKLSRRAIALLLLSRDEDTHAIVKKLENRKDYANICRIIETVEKGYELPLSYVIGLKRQSQANMIAESVTRHVSERAKRLFRDFGLHNHMAGYRYSHSLSCLVLWFIQIRRRVLAPRTAVNFLELRVFHDFIGPPGLQPLQISTSVARSYES